VREPVRGEIRRELARDVARTVVAQEAGLPVSFPGSAASSLSRRAGFPSNVLSAADTAVPRGFGADARDRARGDRRIRWSGGIGPHEHGRRGYRSECRATSTTSAVARATLPERAQPLVATRTAEVAMGHSLAVDDAVTPRGRYEPFREVECRSAGMRRSIRVA
jgi:hypothetical protein